jgi:hypothetical protein
MKQIHASFSAGPAKGNGNPVDDIVNVAKIADVKMVL